MTALREGITPEDRAAWLPINRALSLRQQEEENSVEQQRQVSLMEQIVARQKALEARLNHFIKAADHAGAGGQVRRRTSPRVVGEAGGC